MVVTHFIVSDDVERTRRFYTEVLGGTVVFGPEPVVSSIFGSKTSMPRTPNGAPGARNS